MLGAGRGWAQAILGNPVARGQFQAFFARPDTLTLGVCNGCQMLSQLDGLIPGTEHWPRFARNRSQQFEARLALVEVLDSPSVWLRGMAGARLPIVVAHGEGQAVFGAGTPHRRRCATWTAMAGWRRAIRPTRTAHRAARPVSAPPMAG